jgi:hypothetical protein
MMIEMPPPQKEAFQINPTFPLKKREFDPRQVGLRVSRRHVRSGKELFYV